jgi:hypothetical protein
VRRLVLSTALAGLLTIAGCSTGPRSPDSTSPAATASTASPTAGGSTPTTAAAPTTHSGNPNGHAQIPAQGRAEDTSHPTRVIGDGTPESCTSDAVVAAVAAGGVITFHCGPAPVTIVLTQTAKVRNAHGPRIVLDGGGLVTLSGGGKHRILYMNTCDKAQGWTTSHCYDQDTPQLTVQNLTFVDGNATGQDIPPDAANFSVPGGGGAIFDRGGQLKVVNATFLRGRCDPTGPDVGGAAIRVLDQYQDKPVYVVNSTFGGTPDQGGRCANGGALSSIGVSWVILNSVISYNSAVGRGANPARSGTPGGGSGGAIYTDGDRFTVRVAGSLIEDNDAVEGGGAIFFVSNDRTGTMTIENSVLRANHSAGFETSGLPGIFFLGASRPTTPGSTLTR